VRPAADVVDLAENDTISAGLAWEHACVLSHRLRPATEADIGFLADVVVEATRAQGRLPGGFDEPQWREAFTEWTLEQIRAAIPGSTTSVVEMAGILVGRLRTIRTADSIELCGIQLLPGVQRRGIGTAIVADLQAQAAAAGLPLDLSVEKDNPGASRLYRRLGFAPIAETEEEYRLRWDPRP
jgi:ribosomal protein S18 acetylase RimI-like enzyme